MEVEDQWRIHWSSFSLLPFPFLQLQAFSVDPFCKLQFMRENESLFHFTGGKEKKKRRKEKKRREKEVGSSVPLEMYIRYYIDRVQFIGPSSPRKRCHGTWDLCTSQLLGILTDWGLGQPRATTGHERLSQAVGCSWSSINFYHIILCLSSRVFSILSRLT